ncbi:hypothetical protein JHK84_031647 [Glycine max]|nr:hypothetical protein JHK85_032076 [Glycine max]KAG4994686.1 hypothetical protein JHK86_031513 [Glycine max]KAG5146104.1 hypothetical protein JHK84_031647 [Glycine max]
MEEQYYWNLLGPKIWSNTVRNVMDMKANMGSFLKSFEKWNAPEENCREGRRGRLKFFSEKENQETQQPHRREGNAPEKNPHCVAVVLPGKDAGGRQFLLLLWCCQSKSSLRSCDTEWRRP